MTTQVNENVLNMLTNLIADNGGDHSALAASYFMNYRGDMDKDAWKAHHGSHFEAVAPNFQGVSRRDKFATAQLMKLYDLTYALQTTVLKYGKNGSHWGWVNGKFEELSAAQLADPKYKDSKINKNDINSIRSFYYEQIVKELPKVAHKVYGDFFSLKSSYSYNTNEIRLVVVDPDFQAQGLTDIQSYIPSSMFENKGAEQRKFLFNSWYSYTKPTGKSSEKLAEYFKKLFTSTISRLAKAVSLSKKDIAYPSEEDAKDILDIYYTYVDEPDNFRSDEYTSSNVSKYIYDINNLSADTFATKVKTAFAEGFKRDDYSGRTKVICHLRDLSMKAFVACNYYLVHDDTISQLDPKLKSRADIEKSFIVPTKAEFDMSVKELSEHTFDFSSDDASQLSGISGLSVRGTKVTTSQCIGSERLNSSIFKGIGAHCSENTKDKVSRKKFSPELESVILNSEIFRPKIMKINNKKTSKSKSKTDSSFIISTSAYRKLVEDDSEVASVFENHHDSKNFGFVHTSNMYLSSSSKFHDEDGTLTQAYKFLGFDDNNADLFNSLLEPKICECINNIALPISAYASSLNGKSTKEEKPSNTGYVAKPAPTSVTSTSARNATSSPAKARPATRTSLADKFKKTEVKPVVEEESRSTSAPRSRPATPSKITKSRDGSPVVVQSTRDRSDSNDNTSPSRAAKNENASPSRVPRKNNLSSMLNRSQNK